MDRLQPPQANSNYPTERINNSSAVQNVIDRSNSPQLLSTSHAGAELGTVQELFGSNNQEVVVGEPAAIEPQQSVDVITPNTITNQSNPNIIKPSLDDIIDPPSAGTDQKNNKSLGQPTDENVDRNQQPFVRSETGPTIQQLEGSVEKIIQSPGKFTIGEITAVIIQCFGINQDGSPRSYQDFLINESHKNPTLVGLIEQLKEILLTDEQRYQQNILETSEILGVNTPAADSDTGEPQKMTLLPSEIETVERSEENLTITTGNGEKLTVKNLAAIACFLTLDLAFCRGRGFQMIVDRVTGNSVESILANAGFNVNPGEYGSVNIYEEFIKNVSTDNLVRFIDHRRDYESYAFLKNLDKETRQKMMLGEKFGDWTNEHKLPIESINKLIGDLNDWQIRELELEEIAKKAAQPS